MEINHGHLHDLEERQYNGSEIAIIGFAGRFPGADNVSEFWKNISEGKESISFFNDEELLNSGVDPDLLKKPEYVKARPILKNIEEFDAAFFGFSPLEAKFIDPQHRLFLEIVWQSLESAGCNPDTYDGAISLFAGASMNSYLQNNIYASPESVALAGGFQGALLNNVSSLATLASYKLNLRGPSYSVQSFCSTSLVATHIASQSLLNFECDIALAGGVSVVVPQKSGYLFEEGLIVSPDGHCRPFSDDAQGTIFGNGLGVVVLKRLEDAIRDRDTIHALIIGSAINNDGSLKASYAAPSVQGQKNVIVEAIANAEVSPETITYIEAHGTGTALGDPTEITALKQAFESFTQKKGYCAIGSVKANIGHLDVAAGIAGLIKTILALKHKKIPPSIHINGVNPSIDFEDSPFFVTQELEDWKNEGPPRRAGVSSFGVGGTNSHMILEESPAIASSQSDYSRESLLVISARSPNALVEQQENLLEFLKINPTTHLSDVAHTLQCGRKAFNHRKIFVCSDYENALATLSSSDLPPDHCCHQERQGRSIVFMFPGQGAQHSGMGFDLYQSEHVFRENIDYCSEILFPHLDFDFREVLYGTDFNKNSSQYDINETSFTQPALFVTEYALAQLFLAWGFRPSALIGHSIGEFVAATISGVLSLEQALPLVAERGRLMSQTQPGAMLSVPISAENARFYVSDEVELSVINSPEHCVFSGSFEAIEKLKEEFASKKINSKILNTSHAFHSKYMDPILDKFRTYVNSLDLGTPKIPYISNLTGNYITDEDLQNPDYWVQHLRNSVKFSEGIGTLASENEYAFLEVGPSNILCTLLGYIIGYNSNENSIPSMRHPKDTSTDSNTLCTALGKLWLAGCDIDWDRIYGQEERSRIPLPTYPFERKSHWINPTQAPLGFAAVKAGLSGTVKTLHGVEDEETSPAANLGERIEKNKIDSTKISQEEIESMLQSIWQKVLGVKAISKQDNFFELGGNSLNGVRVFTMVYQNLGIRLPMATLFSAPTIEQLAQTIAAQRTYVDWSSLVEITSQGTCNPLFLLHSEGGNVLEYYPLAKMLDNDRPVFGLQARGLSGENNEGLLSVEDMAQQYVSDIKSKQPKGPYFLGGFCLGGILAFEVARLLEKENEQIAFLGLISSSTPEHVINEKPEVNYFQKVYHKTKEALNFEISNLLNRDSGHAKIKYIRDRFTRFYLIFIYWYEEGIATLYKRLGSREYEHSRPYKLEKLARIQNQAFRAYKPGGPIQNRIILVKPRKQPFVRKNDDNLGWKNLTKSGIQHHTIECFHKNILSEPHVVELAEILNSHLKQPEKQ